MKIKLNKDYVINGIKIHKNSVIEVLSEKGEITMRETMNKIKELLNI
jgi:hypothetical protein